MNATDTDVLGKGVHNEVDHLDGCLGEDGVEDWDFGEREEEGWDCMCWRG